MNAKKDHHCSSCDQALKPNAAQTLASRRNVEYLLKEMESWGFLDPTDKALVQKVYTCRKERLDQANESSISWPVSDWIQAPERKLPIPATPVPEVLASTVSLETESVASVLESSSPPQHGVTIENMKSTRALSSDLLESKTLDFLDDTRPEDNSPSYLNTVLGEADIRWFHSLGALLVVAAVVGWLRASWFSYGRALTGVLIASSPLMLHFIAHRIKRSVPLSSRLMAILANILTPPALLAIDIFGALPAGVSSYHYWTFSLLVSAAVLNWQAHATKEKTPLYVGALCAVMAGWSQGALATAACSLGLGFLFSRKTQDEDPSWNELRQQVSFYSGSFGAIATLFLFETGQNPLLPLSALSVALVFLHLPSLSGSTQAAQGPRIFLQVGITFVGAILMRGLLGLSPGGVGLYLLLAASLFLRNTSDSNTVSEKHSTPLQLACAMGGLGLLIAFFSDLVNVIECSQTWSDASLRMIFSLLSALYFARESRRYNQKSEASALFVIALFSLLGGWLHGVFFLLNPIPVSEAIGLKPLALSLPVFYTLLVVASRWLTDQERNLVAGFVFPLTGTSLVLTCLNLESHEANDWKSVILLHSLFTFSWERGWLTAQRGMKILPTAIKQGLPRLTVWSALLAIPRLQLFTLEQALVIAVCALVVVVYVLRSHYQEACWEAAWILAVLALFEVTNPYFLLLICSVTIGLAPALKQRKHVSLAATCALGVVTIALTSHKLAFPLLYLPAILYSISFIKASPIAEQDPNPLGDLRICFDVLLAAAVILQKAPPSGSLGSIALCISLATLAASFARAQTSEYGSRFLSKHSSLMLASVTYYWALTQGTTESGLVLIILALVLGVLAKFEHKLEICNLMLILGLAQLPSQQQFVFDPAILSLGLILSEILTMIRRIGSAQYSNTALLLIATFQGADSLVGTSLEPGHLAAAAFLAVRLLHQDLILTAGVSAAIGLMKFDDFVHGNDLDLKLRVIPTAVVLIGAGLWKREKQELWAKPTLQFGLSLLVIPAFLQFVAGISLWDNFSWMVVVGSIYLAVSFAVPQSLNSTFRLAGGYTLVTWATVSLTRAALQLPWQAATLVIGLVLVAIGVFVEKKRKG